MAVKPHQIYNALVKEKENQENLLKNLYIERGKAGHDKAWGLIREIIYKENINSFARILKEIKEPT